MDTLVEHRSIFCGEKMRVYSDHKNLTHRSTARDSSKEQRHRLLLEEFRCTISYIPGDKKELADSLTRLPMKEIDEKEEIEELNRLRNFHEDKTMLPIASSVIEKKKKTE